MAIDWHGIYPAVTTQFNDDQSLALEATQRGVARLVDDGVHGIVAMGTVGENCSLTMDEKRRLLGGLVEVTEGRVPLVAGVAEYTTALAAEYAADAEALGADALMVLPGMVYKADAREAVAHFLAVARSTSLPILIYNNPVSYGVDLKPEALAQLAGQPNIVAVKESSEDPRRLSDIRNLMGDRFTLLAGVDDVALESLVLGAVGWVSGVANAFPRESVRLFELAMEGRLDEALPIYRWMMPALHMDTVPKLVQMIKLMEALEGRGSETVRAPRLVLQGEERAHVERVVAEMNATRPVLDGGNGA